MQALVGAAVVDLGALHLAFAWVQAADGLARWERRLVRGAWLGTHAQDGARAGGRDWSLRISGDGGLHLDLPTTAGRVRADVEVTRDVEPATLVTRTVHGGWNATEKAAGYPVRGQVEVAGRTWHLGEAAGGWRDWTAGRQDRRTTWRWAAGAGLDTQGRRVGLNTSTGMNAEEAGEDVVWWDGTPYALDVGTLSPEGDDADGPWSVAGEGWELRFTPLGVRRADERLVVMRSAYVQPIGVFRGRLPDPQGRAVEVTLAGVTEDHLAVW